MKKVDAYFSMWIDIYKRLDNVIGAASKGTISKSRKIK